jgi:phage shock protein PspC (stress-responsive transcriptional regulator)
MNKTVTVNIGGIVFHIEENAYDMLGSYLQAIRNHFTISDGRDEIIQDIESRIAEIFQQSLGTARQVITADDVNQAIGIMGRPEDFGASEDTAATNASEGNEYNNQSDHFFKRRLYRDNDDKVIAGVCSGIGHRLGIDAVWMRLLFIIIFFFAGSGILVYIILAIVMPKAITPTQKLEMRGDPVNISSIRRETETPGNVKQPTAVSRVFDALGSLIKGLFKFVVYAIMAIMAFAGLMLLIGIGLFVLAMLGVSGLTIPIYISDQFLSASQQWWVSLSVLLLIGVPALWLMTLLIKWIFRINYNNRFLNVTAGLLFMAGIVIAFFTAFNIARDFAFDGKVRNTVDLITPANSTMYLKLMDDPKYDEEDNSKIFHRRGSNFSITTGSNFMFNSDDVWFTVQKSPTDKFEMIRIYSAHGATESLAVESARSIIYNFEQKDSLLMFSDHFPIGKGIKYRAQHVNLILKVPVGSSIFIDESMEDIIRDIPNVTDTWDGDMGGHTWKMTENGLVCTDFDFMKGDSTDIHNADNVDISIDNNGVRIKGKDAKSGDKDVNINIGKDGVHIKSTDK